MEFNIKDLLDGYMEEEIALRPRRSPRPEKIEALVRARLEGSEVPVSRPRRARRLLRALPVAALLACLLSVTAYAVSSLLSERVYARSASQGDVVLNLGAPESAEFQAAADWERCLAELAQAGENDSGSASFPEGSREALYAQNGAFTPAARAALDEILDRYSLSMAARLSRFQDPEELYALTGVSAFLPPLGKPGQDPWTGPDPSVPGSEHQIFKPVGSLYEGGSLEYSATALLSGERTVPYDLSLVANGNFIKGAGIVTRGDSFEEWTYTAPGGTELTLDLGASRAFLSAKLEHGYVFLFVRCGAAPHDEDTDAGRVAAYSGFARLDRELLEELAASFDYAALDALCAK